MANNSQLPKIVKSMRKYSVDDLPRFSQWPARILGIEPYEKKKRTSLENIREYEKEKYSPLLQRAIRLSKRKVISIDDVIKLEVRGNPKMLCCTEDEYELLSFWNSFNKNMDMIENKLKKYSKKTSALVEMGAGYGRTILSLAIRKGFPRIPHYAFEYTDSGSKLLGLLAEAHGINVKLGRCDFTTPQVVNKPIPEKSTIFTYYATYNIPKMDSAFFTLLRSLKPQAVIHFEPCYEHCDDKTLTGLMRKRYIELNDLNTNLVTMIKSLQQQGEIKIIEEQKNVFSRNPLLACSVIAWKPNANGK